MLPMTHIIISQYNELSSLITLYMRRDLYTGITEGNELLDKYCIMRKITNRMH
jgi:hypothetical protein